MSAPASSPSADRNLLFGILALQMDFVSRDALIAAMHAWVLHKTAPLGQILVDQQVLRPDTYSLLEALVQKHLQMHDNDPKKSLATLSTIGPAREELEQIADSELHHSLAQVAETLSGNDDPLATRPPSADERTSLRQRFRILRPHARGGLGEVFVAHDTELNREVALKEIQNRHADDPNSRSRFLLEAEVTGGLEHPGIVPVYGLGAYADGRPYYAMRLIQGDSLQQSIARFHEADASDRDPGERTLALRQLLGRFVDVCDAIAYAHSRGVLHRDLKPGNIMIGPYGETLVIDWGLAKTLGDRMETIDGTIAERPLKPALCDNNTPTQLGSAVGTPAYMPPEQAAGQIDRLGPSSDVYSLGATLYCLLTGKPPFEGAEVGEVLRRVQSGEVPAPRAVKPEVPAALEAICLRAMALAPEDRYASPRELAADVERWLADEPVRAWREPLWARLGRWTRHHQTLVAALAAGFVVALMAAGSGAWWLDLQRREQRHIIEDALDDVADLRKQGHLERARFVLAEARDRLGAGNARDLHDKLERAKADLDLVARLEDIRLEWASLVEGRFDRAMADQHYEQAFRGAGIGKVGSDVALAASRIDSSDVRDALVAALEDWVGCVRTKEHRLWILDVLQRVDPDPWRDAVRDPAARANAETLAKLALRPGADEQSPHLLCALAARLQALKGDAEPVLRLAQERHPTDFWCNLLLGNVLHAKGRPREAVGYHRAALALRPNIAVVHLNLGYALFNSGHPEEAVAEYRKAIELDPKDALAHNDLGLVFSEKQQFDLAIAEYRKAIELNPNYAHAHNNLGNVLRAKQQLDDAIVEYKKAIELEPKYAPAHYNFGLALQDKGLREEAILHYRKALQLNPRHINARLSLGHVFRDKREFDEALAEYRKAIELAPMNASAHYGLGLTLAQKGQHDEALAAYYKASALKPKDASIHLKIGYTLSQKGRPNEAIAEYREAIKLDPAHALTHSNLAAELRKTGQVNKAIAECNRALALDPKLALAHYNLGLCLAARGEADQAIVPYRKALELDPGNASVYCNYGQALADMDDRDAAIPLFRQGTERNPKLAWMHRDFAFVLKKQGALEEAIAGFHRALELDPKSAFSREQLARCERMLALDKKMDALLRDDASLAKPSEQLDFAELCLLRDCPVAAVRSYKAAFTAQPQLAEDSKAYRYDALVAAARAAAGRGKDAQQLSAEERLTHHRQAIRWLQDHLALRARQIEHGQPREKALAQKNLRLWQRRADFAVLRDPEILEALPDADRVACRKLWDDVAALLKK